MTNPQIVPSVEEKQTPSIILGIDLGTSGIRGCIVSRTPISQTHTQNSTKHSSLPDIEQDEILLSLHVDFSQEHPFDATETWEHALQCLLTQLCNRFDVARIDAVIADATSSTLMLYSPQQQQFSRVLMYNNSEAQPQAQQIDKYLVQQTTPNIQTAATGASSSLAKVLFLAKTVHAQNRQDKLYILHQIDWLNHYFCGTSSNFVDANLYVSDENNLLKLGYCPQIKDFPEWVKQLIADTNQKLTLCLQLPKAKPAGSFLQTVGQTMISLGFSKSCQVMHGTTDSIAGFLASGAHQLGDSVSSLGSTLAIKQLVQQPIFCKASGLYSHKLKNYWLLGGASNSGGKVLLKNYSLNEINWLSMVSQAIYNHLAALSSSQIQASGLFTAFAEFGDYYPLSANGERFPIANANLTPKLAPYPKETLPALNYQQLSAEQLSSFEGLEKFHEHLIFFNSIVQGLVQVEKQAYDLLHSFGAPYGQLYSVGGGNKNRYWQVLRQAHLQNPLKSAFSNDAAYGVTRLATPGSIEN